MIRFDNVYLNSLTWAALNGIVVPIDSVMELLYILNCIITVMDLDHEAEDIILDVDKVVTVQELCSMSVSYYKNQLLLNFHYEESTQDKLIFTYVFNTAYTFLNKTEYVLLEYDDGFFYNK